MIFTTPDLIASMVYYAETDNPIDRGAAPDRRKIETESKRSR